MQEELITRVLSEVMKRVGSGSSAKEAPLGAKGE